MRNPLNSWSKSDSFWIKDEHSDTKNEHSDTEIERFGNFCVGKNDISLMKKLNKAGNDHAKFMRMINVTIDIVAPLYWWKEFDTYKVGTVVNSCSTMHRIHATEITLNDFSIDNIEIDTVVGDLEDMFINVVADCERLRFFYMETKDRKYWRALIQLLPSSYNQRRTVQLNYQVLKNMYHSRCNHKLGEWRDFCNWMIVNLPCSWLITD